MRNIFQTDILLPVLLSVACLAIFGHSRGQKITGLKSSIQYVVPPSVAVPADLTSFKPFIIPDNSGSIFCAIDPTLTGSLAIPGFTLQNEHYDVEVALMLGACKLIKTRPFEKKEMMTGGQSGSQSLKTTVWYEATYSFPARLKVTSYDGKILVDTFVQTDSVRNIQFQTKLPQLSQWQAHWDKYAQYELSELQKWKIKAFVQAANKTLLDKMGFRPMEYTHTLALLDNERKADFDYDKYNRAARAVTHAFASMRKGDHAFATTILKEAVVIWEDELMHNPKIGKNEKLEKRGLFATHLNLAIAYLWLYDFVKATWHVGEAKKNAPMFSGLDYHDLRRLIEECEAGTKAYPGWTGKRVTVARAGHASGNNNKNYMAAIQQHNDNLPVITAPDRFSGSKKQVVDLLTAHKWKLERIVQMAPGEKPKVAYRIDSIDGTGLASNNKIRYKFFADGHYNYTNPLGDEIAGGEWEFFADRSDEIIMSMPILKILLLNERQFVLRDGDPNGYYVIKYMIPE